MVLGWVSNIWGVEAIVGSGVLIGSVDNFFQTKLHIIG